MKPKASVSVAGRIAASIRRHMIRGLIVVVPLGVTAYALQFCYDLTAGYLAPLIRKSTGPLPEVALITVSVLLFFGMLFLLGVVAAATAGRRIIGLVEVLIRRIPMIKSVYGASKQIVDILGPGDSGANYKSAVLIDFPFPGVKSLAFVSGRMTLNDGKDYYRVFVPTTPNPTSGYLELVPCGDVQASGLSVEDAVKAAMSAGILLPQQLQAGEIQEPDISGGGPRKAEKKAEPPSYWTRNKTIIRNRLLSGVLLLVPVAITVVIVRFVFGLTVGQVTPLTALYMAELPHWGLMVVSAVIFVAGLWVIGAVATAVVGQRLLALGEYVIEKIPMVSTIYSASKQVVATLAMQGEGVASRLEAPVVVEFPCPGMFALGFLVGRVRRADGGEMCKVFLPTVPNISVGLFLMYEVNDVFLCGLSVDEAVRMAVSLGILGPDHMELRPVVTMEPGGQGGRVNP